MSWLYIALGVVIVVVFINIAVVLLLRAWNTDVGPNHESHNH